MANEEEKLLRERLNKFTGMQPPINIPYNKGINDVTIMGKDIGAIRPQTVASTDRMSVANIYKPIAVPTQPRVSEEYLSKAKGMVGERRGAVALPIPLSPSIGLPKETPSKYQDNTGMGAAMEEASKGRSNIRYSESAPREQRAQEYLDYMDQMSAIGDKAYAGIHATNVADMATRAENQRLSALSDLNAQRAKLLKQYEMERAEGRPAKSTAAALENVTSAISQFGNIGQETQATAQADIQRQQAQIEAEKNKNWFTIEGGKLNIDQTKLQNFIADTSSQILKRQAEMAAIPSEIALREAQTGLATKQAESAKTISPEMAHQQAKELKLMETIGKLYESSSKSGIPNPDLNKQIRELQKTFGGNTSPITESDIQATLKANPNLTREKLIQLLTEQGAM